MSNEPGPAPDTSVTERVRIYHVEGRRSQRVIWLCEELNIPYEAIFKRGDVGGSLKTIKEINPPMPMAPTVVFRGKTMVETGGIIEFLMSQFPGGERLAPPVSSPDYADYKTWMYFAEGTAGCRIQAEGFRLITALNKKIRPAKIAGIFRIVGAQDCVDYIENHITARAYFSGDTFSSADIMMEFIATLITSMPFDPATYRSLTAWREKVQQRPAYKRAMDVGLPDGMEALRRAHNRNPKGFKSKQNAS